jgi:hypothetical protein
VSNVSDDVERVRELCLELPEVIERPNHGDPSWLIRRRTIVQFTERNPGDRPGVWCPAAPGEREALVAADPSRFFAPRFGGDSWVGVYLDDATDWAELRDMVEQAYRLVAPRKLVAQLPEPPG